MNEFNKGLYFGANITAEGGGSSTKVECDNLGNNRDYTLVEVDPNGAVVLDDDRRYQRLDMQNRRVEGIRVLCGVNDNSVLRPGDKLEVKMGSHKVVIEGTSDQEVLFNGAAPTRIADVGTIRYPGSSST